MRDEIRAEVLERGVDDRGVFVQSYGSKALDASCLMIPLVGFLPPDDERVVATVEAIDRELTEDGFVRRYHPDHAADDGLPGGEGAFLMCTFWMADCLALMGRRTRRPSAFERLLALRNDVGLLAEQYDPDGAGACSATSPRPSATSPSSPPTVSTATCSAGRGDADPDPTIGLRSLAVRSVGDDVAAHR